MLSYEFRCVTLDSHAIICCIVSLPSRRLQNLLAIFSGLAAIGISILAIRAHFGGNDYLEWSNRDQPFPEVTFVGEEVRGLDEFQRWDRAQWQFHIRANPDGIFCFGRQPFFGYPKNSYDFHLPYCIAIPSMLLLPAVVLARYLKDRWRRLRTQLNLCPNCGYDLRASKDKCPECGMEIQWVPVEENAT